MNPPGGPSPLSPRAGEPGGPGHRVLFISHNATWSGAPLTLKILLEWFSRQDGWSSRLVLREDGPLRPQFAGLLPTQSLPPYPPRRRSILKQAVREVLKGRPAAGLLALRGSAPSQRAAVREALAGLAGECRRWGVQAIFCNTALSCDVAMDLGLDVPVVTHVHELEGVIRSVSSARVQAFRRRTNLFLANSQAVRDCLLRRMGIPDDRIRVVPPPIDVADVLAKAGQIAPPDLRRQLGLAEGAWVVGGVGTICRRKGVDRFLHIVRRLLPRLAPAERAHFVWVGDGPDGPAVRRLLRRLGLASRVVLTGDLPNPYPVMRCFDVALIPSREEPFSRIMMEAPVLGAAAVAFDGVGGTREFLTEDRGVLIRRGDVRAMADGTLDLLRQPDRRRRMALLAADHARQQYDIHAVGPQIAQWLREMIMPSCSR